MNLINENSTTRLRQYIWITFGIVSLTFLSIMASSWYYAYQTMKDMIHRESHVSALELNERLNHIKTLFDSMSYISTFSKDADSKNITTELNLLKKHTSELQNSLFYIYKDHQLQRHLGPTHNIPKQALNQFAESCINSPSLSLFSFNGIIPTPKGQYIISCYRSWRNRKVKPITLMALIPVGTFIPPTLYMDRSILKHFRSLVILSNNHHSFTLSADNQRDRFIATHAQKLLLRKDGEINFKTHLGAQEIGNIEHLKSWPLTIVSFASLNSITAIWWSNNKKLLFFCIIAFSIMLSLTLRLRKKAITEQKIRHYHESLSQINGLIAENQRPGKIYQSVCDLLVKYTNLPLTWIGILDESSGYLQIMTRSGSAAAYVDNLVISIDPDKPEGKGPTACALREERIVVNNDLMQNNHLEYWRHKVEEFNLKSSAMVPFTLDNNDRYVLGAYSSKKNDFTLEILDLLRDTAQAITLGIRQYHHMQSITHLSLYDSLTELPNRMFFSDAMTQALARTDRAHSITAIGIMDLDNFKEINDSFGHPVGDEFLKKISLKLRNTLRQGDIVSRLGGDEFGLLIENIQSVNELESLIARLLEKIRECIQLTQAHCKIYPSASIGLTLYPLDQTDTDGLIRHADTALYQAKKNGKNRWALFEHSLDLQAHEQYAIRNNFPEAIKKKQLELYFQPQINLPKQKVVGAEALVRWNLENGAIRPPSDFMSLIEYDPQLVRELGRFVLKQAVKNLGEWHSQGFRIRVSVNIGARHITHSSFMDDLLEALDNYPAATDWLTLEITETAAIPDLEKCSKVFEQIRLLGVKTSLDDFGTGHSSLHHIQHLPLDELKLDLKFVKHLEYDSHAFSVGYAALELATVSASTVVAEGIEDASTARLWRRLGGQLVQGYLFGKPMQNKDWIEWLKQFELIEDYAKIPSWRLEQKMLPILKAIPDNIGLLKKLCARLCDPHADCETIRGLLEDWREIATRLFAALDETKTRYDLVKNLKYSQEDLILSAQDAIKTLCNSGENSKHKEIKDTLYKKLDELKKHLDKIMDEIDKGFFSGDAEQQ